jgi:pimeloyl-ACP methyl ester carboxylesterase
MTASDIPAARDQHVRELALDLPDGRRLAVRDVGDPAGPVVVLCHAAPGSRLLDPDPGATAGAGVRLVTLDRPGYGGSSPLPAGTVPTIPRFADDVLAVLDALGVDGTEAGDRPVSLVGWSAGGRVALAAAARHPDRVQRVAVVGTPAPHEDVPWIPDEQVAMADALKAEPGGATATLAGMMAGLAAAPPAAAVGMIGSSPADGAALDADPGRRDRLEAMLGEAFAQGAAGLAADIVSYTVADWGFDPGAVRAPTLALYGAADTVVPPAHGEWYAARVPGASLRSVAGSGHLVALTHWADLLDWLTTS